MAIIVVTGAAFDVYVRWAREAGADVVLTKPCLPKTLLAALRRVASEPLESRRRARERMVDAAGNLARAEHEKPSTEATERKSAAARALFRNSTTAPPASPPVVVCPVCDHALVYVRSHLGGVNVRHPEQWDYFECRRGCGTFQYRQRTRMLRRVS
jgi:hypothetical protein